MRPVRASSPRHAGSNYGIRLRVHWVQRHSCCGMMGSMIDEADGTPDPAEAEQAVRRAVERAMLALNQIESTGDSQRDAEGLRATLNGLVDSATHWQRVGDLHPYAGVFRDLGISVLSQLINDLPQHQRFRGWLPENWHGKRDLDLNMALNVMNEGIPLIWVPQSWVVSVLLTADAGMRSDILLDRRLEISHGCLAVLREVTNPELTELAGFAVEATQELMNGRFRPAQALAGNILDTSMQEAADRGVFGAWNRKSRKSIYTHVKENVPQLSDDTVVEQFRRACVLAPVALALYAFRSRRCLRFK
jgi:hypothetical protein